MKKATNPLPSEAEAIANYKRAQAAQASAKRAADDASAALDKAVEAERAARRDAMRAQRILSAVWRKKIA